MAHWDTKAEEVATPKLPRSGCVALKSSLLKPLGCPLVALFASLAVPVENPSVELTPSMPLLRCLLGVHKGEVVVWCHTVTIVVKIPTLCLSSSAALSRL